MSKTIIYLKRGGIGLLVIVLLLGGGGGYYFKSYLPNTVAPQSFPQIDGEIKLDGLNGPVDVYRDKMGIPHIYASTPHDLFFAQGYVHAQDRFWQMDVSRHIGSGRLSEMFGKSPLSKDLFLRTLGWARVGEQELKMLSPKDLARMQAYADGVNAYLADHKGNTASLEYSIVSLLAPGYEPEPWTPLNSITWGKAMAWDLGKSRLSSEVARSILLKTLTPEQLADLYPPYPKENPYIVNDFVLGASLQQQESQLAAQTPDISSLFSSIAQKEKSLDGILDPGSESIGSNNWVISGQLTATGKPMLANDMHLDQQIPSIWYQDDLHCLPVSEECPFDVSGFSFPGVPGVVAGHNQRIAWGFTNVGPDVIDLYIEKINPENPNQYEVNGKWVDMTLVEESIKIAGQNEPVKLSVRYTRNGPIISDTYDPLKQQRDDKEPNFTQKSGIQLPATYAISMRWTALEPNHLIDAILGINTAGNWDEFRAAASNFAVPAQNMVYADVDGNIGYQTPGWIPIRKSGYDGSLPTPGWTDDSQWQGYIPFDKLPRTFNPKAGFIVTANNQIIGPDYPYLITTDFNRGYRARRITDLIANASAPITLDYIKQMHGDNMDLSAAFLVPALMKVDLGDAHLDEVRSGLTNWDHRMNMDSAPAALYASFFYHVLARGFRDDLPKDYWPDGDARWTLVVKNLIAQPDSFWWDDKTTTDKKENLNDILRLAFADSVSELEKRFGKDTSKWNWGNMHTLTLTHTTLGDLGIPPIEALFNRGPFRTGGGSIMVNATGWDTSLEVPAAYAVGSLPSERVIYDLSNLNNSVAIHTTGESGHAYNKHYVDMTDLWRNIQYYPMWWNQDSVIKDAEGHLVLSPK
jgi:penicillin G amidase